MALLPGISKDKPFIADEAPQAGFKLAPPGEYAVVIKAASVHDTANKMGQYLKLQFSILENAEDGSTEYAGTQIWVNLNLFNQSERAVEIAQSTLRQILEATGREEVSDTEELLGLSMLAFVKVQPGRDGYQDQNVIQKYAPLPEEEEEEEGEEEEEKEESEEDAPFA